jgi:hypothetical protein
LNEVRRRPGLKEDAVARKDDKKLDTQGLSAAIAGFLATQVLMCRYLVQEGVIDRENFLAYLEGALEEMAPGIDDRRSLVGLQQLINTLRTTAPTKDLQ